MASPILSSLEPDTAPPPATPPAPKKIHGGAVQDHPEWLRTRRQLRRAAARLIAEQGVLKATPRAITRTARVPAETFAACYATREALFADIMLHHLDGLTCWVIAARDASAQEGAAAQVEAMIGAFLASALAERHEHRLLLRAADLLAVKEREMVRLRCKGLAALFAEVLAEATPRASGSAVKLASLSLVGALSCAVLWFDPDGSTALGGYARVLSGMVFGGSVGGMGLRD